MHTIDDDLFDEKIVNCIRTGYFIFKMNKLLGFRNILGSVILLNLIVELLKK